MRAATFTPADDPACVSAVGTAVRDLRAGELVVVADEAGRGALLIQAASLADASSINAVTLAARGPLCVALDPARCRTLGLESSQSDVAGDGLAPTVSVNAREGITSGVSAADRARTVQVVIDDASDADALVRPGHVLVLQARAGGVLESRGLAEVAVDLVRLAGLPPAAIACPVLDAGGAVAGGDEIEAFAREHRLVLATVPGVVAYRRVHDKLVERVVDARLPTSHGDFDAVAYRSEPDGSIHVALVQGDVRGAGEVLVRVHSECLTGDAFHSMRCDCGQQLEIAMARIQAAGRGVLVYLAQEGRGIGLLHKLRAYRLQEAGRDTVDANLELGLGADLRDYAVGAQILRDLDVGSIRLMTNNPAKTEALLRYGVRVDAQVPIETQPNAHNEGYLRTKAERMGHALERVVSSPSVEGPRS
jgi:3,4-dihydroxy 2-butanone 4-phosphate synthase/GTP cyclohydrolase II